MLTFFAFVTKFNFRLRKKKSFLSALVVKILGTFKSCLVLGRVKDFIDIMK